MHVLAYAPCLIFVARAEVEADAFRKFLDPPAQPSTGSAFNNTPAQVSAVAEDALQLLATVASETTEEISSQTSRMNPYRDWI